MNPENTFYSVKRFIGRKYDEVTRFVSEVSYKVVRDRNGNVKIDCPALKKHFAPEEISSQVLRKLTDDASKYLGERITQAVLTVLAYLSCSILFRGCNYGAIILLSTNSKRSASQGF